MNHEIQLNSQSGVPTASDYWTVGQAAVGSQGAVARQSAIRRAHRVLRGRYVLVGILAAAGAIGGAILGYNSTAPKYRSAGQIQISPLIPQTGNDTYMPMYNQYMTMQLAMTSSSRVIQKAINDPEFVKAWRNVNPGVLLPDATEFAGSIDSLLPRNTFLLEIGFLDKNKEIATAGARALTSAYMQLYGDPTSLRTTKLEFLNNQKADLTLQLQKQRDAMTALASEYGTVDLGVMHNALQEELAKLESDLTQAQIAYEAAQKTVTASPSRPATNPDVLVQQIASVDPQMRLLLSGLEDAQLRLEQTRLRYGDRHPQIAEHQSEVEFSRRRVTDYARDFMQRNAGTGKLPFESDAITAADLNLMKAKLDGMQKLAANRRAEAFKIGQHRARIDNVRAQIDQIDRQLGFTNNRITQLEDEAKLSELVKNVRPLTFGEEASLTADKRKQMATIGFLFGGGLPVGLMLLIGTLDSRFRYSDDASVEVLAGGVTLLGILPNLPDRLSDPQQAGIAAHCVHQIRTMLQINRTNDEPQVLAITSAAPGDGKTSLTLALGLSYAACGARTLLIDCDLMASGLSHRLNINSPDGVLEAVANRALLEFVRTTDIADVAVLPVGTTHAHHASTLSPVALRRLLSESKKHFDIILVDTGPILGSIEASLVCAAADRTILTVARGQQRPLVERSIGHLQAIGARLAGVVFNRAQARDFERSLSGLALRSRPNSNGQQHAEAAQAVAGSFKRAG